MPRFTKQEVEQQIKFVADKATGNWETILERLGITVPHGGKHGPCPACGGKDRFRFDNKEGRGEHYCNQCEAGDGLSLVQKVKEIGPWKAAELVAEVLGISLTDGVTQRNVTVTARNAQSNVTRESRVNHAKPTRQPREEINIADKVAALIGRSVIGESPYLAGKGLSCPHERLLDDSSLLLVLQNIGGEITGAQVIKPDGAKRLISGTQKKGSFITEGELPTQPEVLLIAEGYATVISASVLHDGVAIAAIDAGNLLPVAVACRERWPNARIIFAADNDVGEKNTGKLAADKAALAVNGWVALPPTDYKADWDDYRQNNGIEAAKQAFIESLYQPDPEKKRTGSPELHQMAASQRGALLAERYKAVAVNTESERVYHYDGVLWQKLTDTELCREMVTIFNESEVPYSPVGIKNAIEAMKLQIPVMGEQASNLIGFRNGVYDLQENNFRPHRRSDWLQFHNGITYSHPRQGESLKSHAPNFWRWVSHAASGDQTKIDRILAALFMVLANRYDWQLFLEITGEGGSGKSVFTHIATLLAGEDNTASGSMKALDEARGRAQFVGKSLIILPDQVKYVGEGAGIKAITGGDLVEIDGKYEKQFSTVIHAVVLSTNNEPMTFTERQGGIARRRVIFVFNNTVNDSEKDPLLSEKIGGELPVIIRHLLRVFTESDKAKQLLLEQRNSDEALEIKRGTDPVVDLCAALYFLTEANGMMMGGGNNRSEPRVYLYQFYKSFMDHQGLLTPLSVNKFGRAMKNAAKEYGREYKTRKVKGVTQTNVQLTDAAESYLPRAYGIDSEAITASAPHTGKVTG
ncbi:MAG: primase-helicase zinc-binding domain-containing protein, partial [Enterobacteriaceae bacterium]